MSLEIRPIRDEEIEQFTFAAAYAFNMDRRPEALQEATLKARGLFPLEWSLAAFLEGKLVAGMRVLPLTMRLNGSLLSLGGVGGVACLPEHRRRGYVGALLRRTLGDMRDRGQVLSALYTPHISLYRRYGWEVASRNFRYSFAPKNVKPTRAAAEGRFRRVTVDDWATLNAIYDKYAVLRNGLIVRSEIMWRFSIFERGPTPDAALWEDANGVPQGYVLYSTRRSEPADRPFPLSAMWVRELVTLNPDAYISLVNYLLSHDMHDRIEFSVPADEPLLSLLDDPHRVTVSAWSSLMLRIVDVPNALRSRGCLPQTGNRRFRIGVRDNVAKWNEGVWQIEAEGARLNAEPTSDEADITADVTVWAPIFNGHLSPLEAARAGLLEVANPASLNDAAAVFAVAHPPFCMDWF